MKTHAGLSVALTSLKVRFRSVGQLAACRWPYFSLLRRRKVSKRKARFRGQGFDLLAGLLPAAGLTFLCFAKEK
jgi:hypothetical protein